MSGELAQEQADSVDTTEYGYMAEDSSPRFSATGIIDEYLREANIEDEDSNKNLSFRASGVGTCQLKRYWKRTGKKGEPTDARGLRVFAVGHQVHQFIQNITKKKGVSILQEVELEYRDPETDELLLTGHLDDLIQYKNELILMDYKTVHSRKFHYLGKGEGDTHYDKQIIAYMLMLKQLDPAKYKDLKDLRILYISKDDLCTKEVAVFPKQDIIDAVIKDIYEMNYYYKEKKEPQAIPQMPWECNYCGYQIDCPRGKDQMVIDAQLQAKGEVGNARKSIKL